MAGSAARRRTAAERHRHRVVRVDADQVHELERAHPEAAHQAHHAVDRRRLGDPLLGELQRLQRVGAAAVDQEAGHVRRRDDVLAHRLAERAGRPQARSPEAAPATTSTSLITGAGLKKCIPTTRSGPGTPAAISVTESDEVLVASTQAGSTAAATEPSSSSFSSSRSGAASITSSAGASCPRSARLDAPARRVGLRSPHPALLHLAVERGLGRPKAALERLGHRVVEQRPGARDRGELRDARAHRPRAEHADGPGRGGRGAAGTSIDAT